MSEDSKQSSLCSKVFCELLRTGRMHRAVVDSRMTVLGLHRGQYGILREIDTAEQDPNGKALSQKDIAERFGVSAAAVAMTMKKMEAEGLVSRNMAAMDNRFNELHLTDMGHSRLSHSCDIFREVDTKTFDGITEEELVCMLHCLEKMQKNLAAMPELDGKGEFRGELGSRK